MLNNNKTKVDDQRYKKAKKNGENHKFFPNDKRKKKYQRLPLLALTIILICTTLSGCNDEKKGALAKKIGLRNDTPHGPVDLQAYNSLVIPPELRTVGENDKKKEINENSAVKIDEK